MAKKSSEPSPPPTSWGDLKKRLEQLAVGDRYGRLAKYILTNPEAAASRRRVDFANAVDTDEIAITDFAHELGFVSYGELRALVRAAHPLEPSTSQTLGQVDALFPHEKNPISSFFRLACIAEIRNFEETYAANGAASFQQAARLLNAASKGRVVILGRRSCFPGAYLFHYLYSLFRDNAILSQDAGGTGVDAVRWLAPGDVLVAISIKPYTRETIQAVDYIKQQGAQGASIIAITDNPSSPLAQNAGATLYFESMTPSFFHSIGNLILVVQTLVAILFFNQHRQSSERMRLAEHQLGFFQAYDTASSDGENSPPDDDAAT